MPESQSTLPRHNSCHQVAVTHHLASQDHTSYSGNTSSEPQPPCPHGWPGFVVQLLSRGHPVLAHFQTPLTLQLA